MEIMILCLRPLPAANGGWNSAKWRTPKLASPVSVKAVPDWRAAVAASSAAADAPLTAEVTAVLSAPFLTGLRMEAPATAFELAIAYAGVVAEACSGVVILGDELIADRRASVAVWTGPQIEEKWRLIDAEAAKSDPAYQPVREPADDHRPTQTFSFPIVIDGQEITKPTNAFDELEPAMQRELLIAQSARATKDLSMEETTDEAFETIEAVMALPPEKPAGDRRASGSAPPASGRRITVDIPPFAAEAGHGSGPESGEAKEQSAPRTAAGSKPPHNAPAGSSDGVPASEDDWSDVMPE